MRWPLLVATAFAALGCASPAPPALDARTVRAQRIASYERAFRRAEPILLMELAAYDGRVARRLSDAVSGSGAYVDPFLFSDRRMRIGYVYSELDRCSLPLALQIELGPVSQQLLEQELVLRMLGEEKARLDREEALPGSAAELLRATADAWPQVATHHEQRVVDSLVAWRVDQVRAAVGPNTLSELGRDDLREAIDVLGAIASREPAPRTESAIGKLRLELDGAEVAPLSLRGEEDLVRDLQAQLPRASSIGEIAAQVARAELALRFALETAFSVLNEPNVALVRRGAAADLAAGPFCARPSTPPGMRGLAPPPERAWMCAALRPLAGARGDLHELRALTVLHDLVVVAAWSLDLHGDVRDTAHARARHRPMASLTEADAARFVRDAALHPTMFVLTAMMADLLLRDGLGRLKDRARAWVAFGDAPIDIVERELHALDVPDGARVVDAWITLRQRGRDTP